MVAPLSAVSISVTQLSRAFVVAIALAIEGIRRMFETSAEIRRAARAKFEVMDTEKEERRALNHVFSVLRERGIELPSEAERKLLKEFGGLKWWHRLFYRFTGRVPFDSWKYWL